MVGGWGGLILQLFWSKESLILICEPGWTDTTGSVTFNMQDTHVKFFPDTYQLLKPKKCWQDVSFHFPQLFCSIQYLLTKQWSYYIENVNFHSHVHLKLILSCWKLISLMAFRQQKPPLKQATSQRLLLRVCFQEAQAALPPKKMYNPQASNILMPYSN